MAINPNTNFTAGAILTADQQNRFPRGVMAYAESATNYTLTASTAVATGMTASFTAVAGRYYRVTYYEPQAQTNNTLSGNTRTSIRLTNAGGTQFSLTILQNETAAAINGTITCTAVVTLSAGATTIVGCAITSSTSGAPVLIRGATSPSFILVEDIGQS